MKKTHLLVSSALTILLSGSLIAGATYSLFTSESTHDITVASGKVLVESYIDSQLTCSSMGKTQVGTSFANGGSATIQDNNLVLSKICPGDSVTFNVGIKNYSTVSIKYKVSFKVTSLDGIDLFEALEITPDINKDWTDLSPDANPKEPKAKIEEITIALPSEAGNYYKNKSCVIAINVEAIQANGKPVDISDPYTLKIEDALTLSSLNKHLATMEPKAKTMSEASSYLLENGLDIETITLKDQTSTALWDQDSNKFLLLDSTGQIVYPSNVSNDNNLHLWKIVDKYELDTSYSQYLRNKVFSETDLTLEVDTGLDVGRNYEGFNVTYNGENDSSVIINTSNPRTNLTVSTALSHIDHYGSLGKLTINEVPALGYFEYGTTAFAEVHKGQLMIKQGSTVDVLLDEPSLKSDVIISSDKGAVNYPYAISEEVAKNHRGNVKLTYKDKDAVLLEGQSAIDRAIKKELPPNDLLISDQKSDVYASLGEFRDAVNSGTSFADKKITLLRDVDLSGVSNWEPIGTIDHPFVGKFDGNSKTIKNVNIKGEGNLGLFGVVSRDPNSNMELNRDILNVWVDPIIDSKIVSEDKLQTSIQNLKLDNINTDVTITNNTSNSNYGGLVGNVAHTYISNIEITNSNIIGHNNVGSIAGLINGCVFNDCSNNSSTKVIQKYFSLESGENVSPKNSGGLVGSTSKNDNYSFFANNVNNAVIINSVAFDGYIGGIVGSATEEVKFYDNVNNADFLKTNIHNDTKANSKVRSVGGICGYIGGGSYQIRSINNGKIECDAIHSLGGIVGEQTSNRSISIYFNRCKNLNIIKGASYALGGMVGDGNAEQNYFTSCEVSSKPVYDGNDPVHSNSNLYAAFIKHVDLINQTFETTEELLLALKGSSTAKLKNVTVSGAKSTITLPSEYIKFESDNEYKNYCSDLKHEERGVTIANFNPSETEISVPNFEYTVVNSEKSIGDKLHFSGINNNITLASGITVVRLEVSGKNSKILLKSGSHTTQRVSINGEATTLEIEQGAEVNGIGVSGSGNKQIINRGLVCSFIEYETTHEHLVRCSGDCNVTINNYGTISNQGYGDTDDYTRGYALASRDKCRVILNLYKGSIFESKYATGINLFNTKDDSGTITKPCASIVINVNDGAQILSDGVSQVDYISDPRITVNKITA